MSVASALRKLLDGSGFEAVPAGVNTWRLVPIVKTRSPKPVREPPIEAPTPPSPQKLNDAPPSEIIVTAAKRTDALETTPIDSTVIDGLALTRFSGLPGSAAVANLATSLALSNIGPGRNRAFLRGVSDSPFNGQTQSTVATLIDDARVTFNAPDPDLRLIDVERIELLKGPQGPLYGTGAIGGVFRIVTAKPNLDAFSIGVSANLETLASGGFGAGVNGSVNLPLVKDKLALRVVGYQAHEPGWIDNDRPDGKNSNSSDISGGRLALRWKPSTDWTADLAGVLQLFHVDDSQYVVGPSPRRRSGIRPEPHDNDFANLRLSVAGKLGNLDVFSITSATTHEVDSLLDASPAAGLFGITGPVDFEDNRLYNIFNQELRATGQSGKLHWLLGGSFLSATTKVTARLLDRNLIIASVGTLNQEASEAALFGDVRFDLSDSLTAELGGRLFSTNVRDEKIEGGLAQDLRSNRTGVSPSLAISLKPNSSSYYYLRAASAFRPRGLSSFATAQTATFASDELVSIELGGRWHSDNRKISGQAVLYGSRWSDIQSDYLLPNGLVATRNSGRGSIYGVDASAEWHPIDTLTLTGAVTLQHPRLERAAPGLSLPNDRQLPVVPAYKAKLGITHDFEFGAWHGDIAANGTLSGPTRLSLDPGLDRRTRHFSSVDLTTNASNSGWIFGISIQNIFNSGANTFAFGNPFSIQTTDQRVPLRPRSLILTIGWRLQ
jgi:iron complex outermembrane recepter protein